MSAPSELGELNNATLASLLFELASQLHIERARRLALESALVSGGVITPASIATASESASFRQEVGNAADLSVRKLIRVLSESPDERVPLRAEAHRSPDGES